MSFEINANFILEPMFLKPYSFISTCHYKRFWVTKLLWFYKVGIERGEVMNPSYDLNIPFSLVMWYLSLFSWHKWIQRITSNTWFRYKRSFIGPWASLNVTVDLVNSSNILYPHCKDYTIINTSLIDMFLIKISRIN